jgi:hypothetical protein
MDIKLTHYRAGVADCQGIDEGDFVLVKNENLPDLAVAFGFQVEGRVRAAVGRDRRPGEGTDEASDKNDSHLLRARKGGRNRSRTYPAASRMQALAPRAWHRLQEGDYPELD